MGHVQTSRVIKGSQEELFKKLSDFSRLPEWVAPYMEVEIQPYSHLQAGVPIKMTVSRFGQTRDVAFVIDQFNAPIRYAERQMSGFFSYWYHSQTVEIHDSKHCLVTDIVEYSLPLGLLGRIIDDIYFRFDLQEILEHRYDYVEGLVAD